VSNFLIQFWALSWFRAPWKRITLRRHKSELRALMTARAFTPLAIFPIFLTVGMWFFLLVGLPSLILFVLSQVLLGTDGAIGPALGAVVFVIHSILALFALCLVAPWFFGWYFIAAGLMFGRTAMADRKEAELTAAIKAQNPTA
jgi:hypothetical protein